MAQKILAIDNEKDILKLLEYNLGKAGFNVISAQDGPEAIEMARGELPDLIILDIMLASMEGTDVLKALKKDNITEKIPVIILTSKGEELDMVAGLELGADDYIIKPFSVKELLLRVNASLKKRQHGKEANLVKSGILFIDYERFLVRVNENSLKLTAAEFKLLSELVMSNGRLLNREYLVRRIGNADVRTTLRTIDTHIRRLRIKLGEYSRCIETVRGIGYRFMEDDLKRTIEVLSSGDGKNA